MSKNQTPKATSMPTFDGRQIRIQDGLQMVTNGAQVMSEGCKWLLGHNKVTNFRGYGRQTSGQTTSQSSFAPASGPKIPPMKK